MLIDCLIRTVACGQKRPVIAVHWEDFGEGCVVWFIVLRLLLLLLDDDVWRCRCDL